MNRWVVVGSLLSALTVTLLVRSIAPPVARLAERVRPYGYGAHVVAADSDAATSTASALARLVWVVLKPLAKRMSRMLDRDGGTHVSLRLRQSGLYRGLDDEQELEAYRVRQLGTAIGWMALSVVIGIGLELPAPRALALAALGLLVGVSRNRGRIDRAIRRRQEIMRIEIYTVNQLLAMRVRAGGGVVHAVQQIVTRGHGEVVSELGEALRLHRAGMRASEAFGRIAATTPEAACTRTYALLGAADERGADLAGALLELSEDVRESRREALRRAATRRRAAMLVPIIGILAPVMLLFVGAPLPRIIFDWR
jgi:tight adherence protein C